MNAKANRKRSKKYRAALGPTVWLAPAHTWEITKDEDGGYSLTNWQPEGISSARTWGIVPQFYDERAIQLARTHETWPLYVVKAMREHCGEG